jgi:hypothetical protein
MWLFQHIPDCQQVSDGQLYAIVHSIIISVHIIVTVSANQWVFSWKYKLVQGLESQIRVFKHIETSRRCVVWVSKTQLLNLGL